MTANDNAYLITGNPRIYKRATLFAPPRDDPKDADLAVPLPWPESSWMNVSMDELRSAMHPYPSSRSALTTMRSPESVKHGQQNLGLNNFLVGVQGRVAGNESAAIVFWSKMFSLSRKQTYFMLVTFPSRREAR